jgi:hypothetical protein
MNKHLKKWFSLGLERTYSAAKSCSRTALSENNDEREEMPVLLEIKIR